MKIIKIMDNLQEPGDEYPQDDNGVNPFLAFSRFDAIQQPFDLKRLKTVTKDQTTYISGDLSINYYAPIDAARSCKLFQSKEAQAMIFRLDNSALRLFIYILSKLARKSDKIKIETLEYMKFADIKSFKTFYTALNNLRQEGVIAKYKKNVFWINPNVLFSGNRLEKYPDKMNIVKYAKFDKQSKP